MKRNTPRSKSREGVQLRKKLNPETSAQPPITHEKLRSFCLRSPSGPLVLTGLYSKSYCEQWAEGILETDGILGALLLIDIDNFKEANDTFGHQYGDDILRRFAQALTHAVRHHDAVGRFGGDEFVLVLNNLPPQTVAYIARRINATAQDLDVDADGHTRLSASIGAAFYPEHGTDYQELLYKADRALYKVKKSGRNSWASAT